jgi:hypothetical protein
LLNVRAPAIKTQPLIGFSLFVIGVWLAWHLGGDIAGGDMTTVVMAGVASAGAAALLLILRSWRMGFYIFFVWIAFEDFVRKYMGNGLAFFFGKDVLLAAVYLSFFIAVRRKREKVLRPPFMIFFVLFFWLGVLELFNSNSPHILYGLLGMKVYFFYVPLLFVGYSLIRSDEDLRRFLLVNAILAAIVAGVGIVQSILGNSFLNPATLAPELQELGDLHKSTPLSGQIFNLPDSVFVSAGRYSQFLVVAFVLMLGAAGYLLMSTNRSRKLVFMVTGALGVAALLCGNRGAFVYCVAAAILLPIGFLWGAPWRQGEGYRVSKAIRRSAIAAAASVTLLILLYPKEAGARLDYYVETMAPSSSAYQVSFRAWDYPIQGLVQSFQQGSWVLGHGIGTTTLGRQYVAKFLHETPPPIGVEEGYGQLILQMGILGPLLWLLWTGALVLFSWRVVRSLRGTRFFPLALAILFFAFVLLFPWTYASLSGYEDYTINIYLWLLVGILFRLPELALAPRPLAEIPLGQNA